MTRKCKTLRVEEERTLSKAVDEGVKKKCDVIKMRTNETILKNRGNYDEASGLAKTVKKVKGGHF